MLSSNHEAIALDRVQEALRQATNPIVLWSSGKDSTVVLHLTLRLRTVPVMWWRLPKFPEKQQHGNWVARIWNLEVHDAMPLFVEDVQHEGWWEAVHAYGPDPSTIIGMTTGVLPHDEEQPYLCAVTDLLQRPTVPSQGWPWDLCLQGHREAETPYFGTTQKFMEATADLGKFRLCNPIFDWPDDQVWGYIKRYKLPIDKRRYYDKQTAVSPDHYPTCKNCVDANQYGQTVWCPKLQEEIPSIAKAPETHRRTLRMVQQQVRHVRYAGEPQKEVSAHV